MPRWSLVVLAIAAILLVARPLGWIPGSYEAGAMWGAFAALVIGAGVAGKQNLAIWCGIFAALAILFQPLFPVDLKEYARWADFGGAVLVAVCVVREWE